MCSNRNFVNYLRESLVAGLRSRLTGWAFLPGHGRNRFCIDVVAGLVISGHRLLSSNVTMGGL
jgi:hypothetical protein